MCWRKGKEYVYIKYSREYPYLPVLITLTLSEMADITGIKAKQLGQYMRSGVKTYKRVRIDDV